jgi:LuxR family transcriptional regulator, regulator of acetate metabolism
MIDRSVLIGKLAQCAERGDLPAGFELMSSFVGAEHYMLARQDMLNEDGFDHIVSSNWPFDVVRTLGQHVIKQQSKRNELERCMAIMEPAFIRAPATLRMPEHLSRIYCAFPFCTGQARLSVIFLFRSDIVVARERVHDVALLSAYFAARFDEATYVPSSVLDLTEREIECLNWIAEGKTSDEISMIIGISRNTVNNYITSIMRKTATKTRSEAIAYAVRHSLI